jgi:hypothetical protein
VGGIDHFHGLFVHRDKRVPVQQEGGFDQANGLFLGDRLVERQAEIGTTGRQAGILD